jgi:hypothetical protein
MLNFAKGHTPGGQSASRDRGKYSCHSIISQVRLRLRQIEHLQPVHRERVVHEKVRRPDLYRNIYKVKYFTPNMAQRVVIVSSPISSQIEKYLPPMFYLLKMNPYILQITM